MSQQSLKQNLAKAVEQESQISETETEVILEDAGKANKDEQEFAPPQTSELTISEREKIAGNLPFGLRAWWLRDHQQAEGLEFGMMEGGFTVPMQSLQSDPLCDAGNLDTANAI